MSVGEVQNDPIVVLVVDDEPDLVDILTSEIQELGYSTLSANNGKMALDKMKEVHSGKIWIDAVISDINMPQMNGLEFLKEMRQLGLETPFVFFSGYGDKEKTLEALRLGALDFLEKPYNPDVLIKTVQKAAQMGRQLRDIEKEVEELCKKMSLPAEELENFKNAQKELLKFKKMSKVYFNK